jgi:nucleoid DNA-binding protein
MTTDIKYYLYLEMSEGIKGKMLEVIKAAKAKATEADILGLGSATSKHTAAKTRKNHHTHKMAMIDDYIVVKGRNKDEYRFYRDVKRNLADGYLLQGGVFVDKDYYYQALTKKVLESKLKSRKNDRAEVDLLNDVSPELLKLGED